MIEWPSVCTHDIGRSSLVKHRIITKDEVPVRKRAYKVSIDKQRLIDSEVKELLAQRDNLTIYFPLGFTSGGSSKKRWWFKAVCGLPRS